jgi:hypothetical protein
MLELEQQDKDILAELVLIIMVQVGELSQAPDRYIQAVVAAVLDLLAAL